MDYTRMYAITYDKSSVQVFLLSAATISNLKRKEEIQEELFQRNIKLFQRSTTATCIINLNRTNYLFDSNSDYFSSITLWSSIVTTTQRTFPFCFRLKTSSMDLIQHTHHKPTEKDPYDIFWSMTTHNSPSFWYQAGA